MTIHDHDPLFDPLRAEMDRLDTPPGVEQELMRAFARQFPRKRGWSAALPALPRSWAVASSFASIVAAVLLFALTVVRAPVEDRHSLIADDAGGVFIALDSIERIEREPNPRLVETEVARTALAPLGLALTPENAGQTVKAELLVGADGQPLALRLRAVD